MENFDYRTAAHELVQAYFDSYVDTEVWKKSPNHLFDYLEEFFNILMYEAIDDVMEKWEEN